MVISIIIFFSRKQSKKKELQYTNVIAKMELLEVEMVDECKGGESISRGIVVGGNLVGSPFDWKHKVGLLSALI